MRRACIDIGSNTTRLLVADLDGGTVCEVGQDRVFTHLRRGLKGDGTIGADLIEQLAAVVRAQRDQARSLGAQQIVVVATAAVRRARNGAELAGVLARECDVELRVLSEADEARLAFLGACAALDAGGQTPPADEPLGVVDVGGGSSELVLGRFPDGIDWFRSLPLGSGIVADACFTGDPPTSTEVGEAYAQAAKALEGVEVPRPARAIAVGGSAASLCRLAGARLDAAAFRTALDVLLGAPAEQVAARFDLAADRVRLLPGGLVILETVQRCFGVPLELVGGGLREGVLLEAARH